MFSTRPSLFSPRCLILLLLSLCGVRSLGQGLEEGNQANTQPPQFGLLFPLNPAETGLDTFRLQAERETAESVLGSNELFILSSSEDSSARR